MFRLTGLSVRAFFLIGFIIALPVLAIPKISELTDRYLYGPEKAAVGDGTAAPAGQTIEPYGDIGASPASFDAPLFAPESHGPAPERAPWQNDLPPSFGPEPRFASRGDTPASQAIPQPPAYSADTASYDQGGYSAAATTPASPFGEEILSQLQQIRAALELMGAQALVLEAVEGTSNYHFHCEVQLNPQSPYTRQFEAVSPDPLLAAETVLAEVTRFRQASPAGP